jgi:acyl-CoA synthetase (AMP-forming)/AMP-acid ligase II/NAD-dependent dihydropyrimidine dehydrogenase PreA subunit
MKFESLVQLGEYRAAHESERLFLSVPEDGIDVTYGLLYQFVRELARFLQSHGLQKGQRVAIILENGLGWALSCWGVLYAGGVVVPLNPRFKPAEAASLLQRAEVCLIITDNDGINVVTGEFAAGKAARFQTNSKAAAELLVVARRQDRSKATQLPDIRPQDEALLIFTSGSTGVPKGVILTHGNLLAASENIRQAHNLTVADIALCVLPFFHANGLIITLITSAFSGGRVVVPRKFSARHFWEWANRYRVTWFSAVPTILSILLSSKAGNPVPKSLRFARSASAALPKAVFEEFERRFKVPIIESYGLSETASQVTTNPLPPATRKVGSVGKPVGNELSIVDEYGVRVLPGVEGEVVIRGANVMPGYLNNPEANREAFKNGWFYTGDIGYFDQDGYLFLTGRRKEFINRAGEKFSPREVDEILYQLPEIETAAAVGVPDSLFGEEIVAFIQLRPGMKLSADQVIAHCRQSLVDFKVPKEIFYIGDFPKGPNGKVQRCRLADIYHQIKQTGNTIEGKDADHMACEIQAKKKHCVKIDDQACKECGYCIEVCPKGIFSQANYFNAKGYRPVQVQNDAACIGCRQCFYACPDFAINIKEVVEDQHEKNI